MTDPLNDKQYTILDLPTIANNTLNGNEYFEIQRGQFAGKISLSQIEAYMDGFIVRVATKVAANAIVGTLNNKCVVMVDSDETQGGVRSIYSVVNGAFTDMILDKAERIGITPIGNINTSNLQSFLQEVYTRVNELQTLVNKLSDFRNVTIPYSTTLNWDVDSARIFSVTLSSPNTLLNMPSNLRPGAFIIYVKQDEIGSRSLNFASGIRSARGQAPLLSTNPNAVDILSFVSDGTYLDVSIQANES